MKTDMMKRVNLLADQLADQRAQAVALDQYRTNEAHTAILLSVLVVVTMLAAFMAEAVL